MSMGRGWSVGCRGKGRARRVEHNGRICENNGKGRCVVQGDCGLRRFRRRSDVAK